MRNFLTVDAKNAEILNASFSDPVNNLKISEFHVGNPFADKTSQRILFSSIVNTQASLITSPMI